MFHPDMSRKVFLCEVIQIIRLISFVQSGIAKLEEKRVRSYEIL
jgi:hypothetical protein